jgi:Arc/MetJ-type ribon-helix-helix transcriptional regulator
MGIVPVRIDDEDLKKIDVLVKREAYRSRNEAIRQIIKAKLAESLVEDEDVTALVETLLKMKRKGREPVTLRFTKSAAEIVSEGRDRWPTVRLSGQTPA